jgi:DUF1009 family protein
MATIGEPLTIVAGGGSVPVQVARAAAASGRKVLIVGIEGEADPQIAEFPHEWLSWGAIGRIDGIIQAHGGRDIVLIGGVKHRPDFKSIKFDFKTLGIVPELLAIAARGDSDLLTGVVKFFETRGYHIVGAHEVLGDLVVKPGAIGARSPSKSEQRDAELALKAARGIGGLDAGQAAIVLNGRIVALEAAEGTDEMVERVAMLRQAGRIKWKDRAGVLAKCAKPQQDLRVDMPAIGPHTIDVVAAAGLAGIVVEAGRVMIVDRAETIRRAEAAGLFVLGEVGAPP